MSGGDPKSVGLLAYGSLMSDPGPEITAATLRIIENVETPFAVEFARASDTRGGGPTLIPVDAGGMRVRAKIIVVDASPKAARDMLYRREIHKAGSGQCYQHPRDSAKNRVRIKELQSFAGIDLVLYTHLHSNFADLTPAALARAAVESVARAEAGKDGISYLEAARAHSICTALSEAYGAEILRLTGAASLQDALHGLGHGTPLRTPN